MHILSTDASSMYIFVLHLLYTVVYLIYLYTCRVVEMETIDLGLSAEGEMLNNRSVRDRNSLHQRNKEKKPLTVFRDRAHGGQVGNHDSPTEETDERDGEGEENEESGTNEEGQPVVHQHFKRRRIQFRTPTDAELANQDATESSTGAVKDEEYVEAEPQEDVYNQNGLTDEQFISLQNRIKNRPVSAVNGTYEMHIARPISGMKGHTAFLTFAVCPLQS